MNETQILQANSAGGAQMLYGGRNPKDKLFVNGKEQTIGKVHKQTKEVFYINRYGRQVANSALTKDEWKEIETTMIEPAHYPLVFTRTLRSKGLVRPLGGIGTLISTWYMTDEASPATINMTGQGNAENTALDNKADGAPVPVIFKPYKIDARMLDASRRTGDGIDVTTLSATRRVVEEALEDMIVNGANVKMNGFSLYGLRTHPGRVTDTASDWGTIANITASVNSAVRQLQARQFYGPYALFVSQEQYLQAVEQYFGSDSNITPLSRVLGNPLIDSVDSVPSQVLPDGEFLLVQLDRETIDLAEALPIQLREWSSGDGWQMDFKVLTVAGPRVKKRYDGYTGIAHFSGA